MLPLMMALMLHTSCTEDEVTPGHISNWDENYEYNPEDDDVVVVPETEDPSYTYPDTVTITYPSDYEIYTDVDTSLRMLDVVIHSDTTKLEYTFSPDPIDIDLWEWTSSDNDIVNIDMYGKIIGAGVGTATVKVNYLGSNQRTVADSMLVSVYYITAESIDLTAPDGTSIFEGTSTQLTYTLSPSTLSFPDAPLAWTCSNELVATVDESGLVYAYSSTEKEAIKAEKEAAGESTEGIDDLEFTITATPTDGADTETVFAQIDFTIKQVDADAGVVITTTTATYCANRDIGFQIAYTQMDGSTTTEKLTWVSDNSAVATVDEKSGYVTLTGAYGDVNITVSHTDTSVTDTYSFSVPAGWWIESYDNVYTSALSYLFTHNPSYNTWSATEGSFAITATYDPGYTVTSKVVDDVTHASLDNCRRVDLWCHNEATCVLNANTYKYLAFHLDEAVAKDNVIYHEWQINLYYSDGSTRTYFTVNNINDYSDSRLNVYHLSDDSIILAYDLSSFGSSMVLGDLTEESTSYDTPYSLSVNYFIYGYDNATTVDGILFPAMDNFTVNLYSVQTFATDSDIAAYITSEGLTVK